MSYFKTTRIVNQKLTWALIDARNQTFRLTLWRHNKCLESITTVTTLDPWKMDQVKRNSRRALCKWAAHKALTPTKLDFDRFHEHVSAELQIRIAKLMAKKFLAL